MESADIGSYHYGIRGSGLGDLDGADVANIQQVQMLAKPLKKKLHAPRSILLALGDNKH